MDDVLIGKATIIERCIKRIHEEYDGHEAELETNFTRQDALMLNLLRATEASIDGAMHLVRIQRLGVPADSRQAFTLLMSAGTLDRDLGKRLESMVGFRNIAVHDYREIDMAVVRSIIAERLHDLAAFARIMVRLAIPEQQAGTT
jgi:uncharacterized protein YutE (UPF0331/DUF86 family)